MDDEFLVRSSLDNQIKEAKSRAELFSKSLHDARAQEAIALKILEEERERWAHSFEEKSIMIEQLERELTFTVEALDVERSTDKMPLPKFADLKVFSNEEVEQTFHELMEEVTADLPVFRRSLEGTEFTRTTQSQSNGQYGQRKTPTQTHHNSHHGSGHPRSNGYSYNQSDINNVYDTFENDRYRHSSDVDRHNSSHVAQNGSAQQQHFQQHQHHASQTTPYQHHHHSIVHHNAEPAPHTAHSVRAHSDRPQPPVSASTSVSATVPSAEPPQRSVTPPRAEAPRPDDSAIWRDLLNQYQEQLKLAKSDAASASDEKEKLGQQVARLEQQLAKVTEEKELFATACENAEGKLKFRVAQVLEYEQDKESQSKRITDLSALNGELQTQLHALRHELLVANTELRVHSSRDKDLERQSWEKRSAEFGRSIRSVLTLDAATLTDSAPNVAATRTFQEEHAPVELSLAARQQVQAAEAHAQELRRQLTESHGSYGIQLDEAKKVASSLQMLLKDTERRGDEFRTRCHFAEQAAAQFKAERDALLTMLSKLHLAPQAETAASAPSLFYTQQTPMPPIPTPNATPSQSQSVFMPEPSVAHLSAANVISGSSSASTVPVTAAHWSTHSQSQDQLDPRPRRADFIAEHNDQAPPPAKVQGIAVVPFLSRSEDFSVRQGLPCAALPAVEEHQHQQRSQAEDPDSSLEAYSDGEDMLRPESATGSVLDMAGRLHADSLESAGTWPAGSTEAAAPQFVSHPGRGKVSLQGMLATSNDTAVSVAKKSSARRLRSGSGEGHSIQKSKSKSKSPTAATLSTKRTVDPNRTRHPAPAVGQPGKSMVIRKPPSYTGASNEVVRGSASPEQVKKGKGKTPPAQAVKGVKKSASTSPRAAAVTATKVPTPRASPDASAAKPSAPVPVPTAASLDHKDFVPASYSNRHDISWESEVSRADTSGLSHDVEDFADADAHFEQHATDDEERTALDAPGLTAGDIGAMGTISYPHVVSEAQLANHRYYEGDEFFEGEEDSESESGDESVDSDDDENEEGEELQQEAPLPHQMTVSVEKDLLDHTIEFTRMQDSLGQGGYSVHDLHAHNAVPPAAAQTVRASLDTPAAPRSRSNSFNSASASIVSAGTDRSSRRGSGGFKQPKYTGITDIKISRKTKPGDAPVQPRSSTKTVAAAPPSSAHRSLRTPSPMTRGGAAGGSSGHASKSSSSKHRAVSTPRTRILSTAAVVTPGTSGSSGGRIISAGSSVLKKNPKDKFIPGSASRQRSLMY